MSDTKKIILITVLVMVLAVLDLMLFNAKLAWYQVAGYDMVLLTVAFVCWLMIRLNKAVKEFYPEDEEDYYI